MLRQTANPVVLLLLSTCSGIAMTAFAGDVEQVVSPSDARCTLEFLLPEGATISLGGRDHGAQRSFALNLLDAESLRSMDVVISFPDGSRQEHKILVKAGWHVRFAGLETTAGRPELVLEAEHTSGVSSVAFCPNGQYILTRVGGGIGRPSARAILWDVAADTSLRTIQARTRTEQHEFGTGIISTEVVITAVAFSPNGRRIITGVHSAFGRNPGLIAWDTASGRELRAYRSQHRDQINAVAYSPDGRRIVAGDGDPIMLYGPNLAFISNASNGDVLHTLKAHDRPILSVAFSPDSQRVVTGGMDKAIVWDASTGAVLHTLDGHASSIRSVAYSPDGEHLLTGSWDNTAILWNASSGKAITTFEGHSSAVGSVAFSPDGRQALTGSNDTTAILWDVASGEPLRRMRGHGDSVMAVAFRSDGRVMITGSADGTVRLWDVATGQELVRLISFYRNNWLAVTPEGLFDGSETGIKQGTYRLRGQRDPVPLEELVDAFHWPGLLAAIMDDERPLPGR